MNKRVFYHTKYNRFFVIHSEKNAFPRKSFVIGGLCEFFNDAFTNIERSQVSSGFLKDAIEITDADMDTLPFMRLDPTIHSWRVVNDEDMKTLLEKALEQRKGVVN